MHIAVADAGLRDEVIARLEQTPEEGVPPLQTAVRQLIAEHLKSTVTSEHAVRVSFSGSVEYSK